MKLGWQQSSRNTLSKVSTGLVSGLLLFCLGCVHRTPHIRGTYHLEENAGFPLLMPLFASTLADGDFQTARLFLPGNDQNNTGKRPQDCSVDGEIFSLRFDHRTASWTVRSLSLQGWNHRGGEVDINALWALFAQKLDLLERRGCFAPGEDSASIRRAVAAVIPLPASELQLFFYAADAKGFVDLAPGLEIKFEELRPSLPETGPVPSPAVGDRRTATGPKPAYGYFQVVSASRGTALRRSKPEPGISAKENSLYSDLPNRFAATPLMRLFFEALSENGTTRSAMLLGASNLHDLDATTELIRARGKAACETHQPGVVCVVFVNDSVSLLESLWINGRSTLYPLGTQLVSLLRELPQDKRARALSSVRVMRPLASGTYAEYLFPKTMEGLTQVTLLPGDRVAWQL